MHFLWPHNLWWMLALPLLPALYLWLLRRGSRHALVLSSLRVVRDAVGPQWRRHVPPALMFGALALLLLALARPTAAVTLPWARSTILLAVDISRSMRVADVQPSRMVAAQDAAKAFLSEVPPHIEVGLVTFAGSAQVAQQATIDRASVVEAVDAIQMQYGTAIGNAIVVCLAELFPAATRSFRRQSPHLARPLPRPMFTLSVKPSTTRWSLALSFTTAGSSWRSCLRTRP